MGPYCKFCDHRCFVERRIPGETGTVLLATCTQGAAYDRQSCGYDYTTAPNPYADRKGE